MITQQELWVCSCNDTPAHPPSTAHFMLTVIYEFHHNPQLGYTEKPINYCGAHL
jgi:hypothetical protein